MCCLGFLEQWLRERKTVQVVISSSWREHRSLAQLQAHFSADLHSRVIGATPMLHRVWGQRWGFTAEQRERARYERQAEILLWLQDQPIPSGVAETPPWRWAALDDQAALFEPGCPHLVLCDPKTGLDQATLARLDRLLFPVQSN